jgi:hypothetical protein
MSRQVYLLVIGIAMCVTLPFAWFIARQYGGWWGAAYALHVFFGGDLADAALRPKADGPIKSGTGTVANPSLQLGASDGTGLSRSANAIVMSVQGATIFGTFAGATH